MAPVQVRTGATLKSWLGLIEILAAVRDFTGASWNSWPPCVSALGHMELMAPCAGAHKGFFEVMAPVRDRTGASSKTWPLCGIALGPHRTHGPRA